MKKICFLYLLFMSCLTLINCSDDTEENSDVIPPILEVRSPGFNGNFSTGASTGLNPEKILLEARAVDAQDMKSLQLIVTHSNGTIVFEKTVTASDPSAISSEPGSGSELIISDNFETTNAGTYNVVYVAIDLGENETLSPPRTFFYQD